MVLPACSLPVLFQTSRSFVSSSQALRYFSLPLSSPCSGREDRLRTGIAWIYFSCFLNKWSVKGSETHFCMKLLFPLCILNPGMSMRWAIMEIYRNWITTFLMPVQSLHFVSTYRRDANIFRVTLCLLTGLLYWVFYLSQILWRMLGVLETDAENHCTALLSDMKKNATSCSWVMCEHN